VRGRQRRWAGLPADCGEKQLMVINAISSSTSEFSDVFIATLPLAPGGGSVFLSVITRNS
jgi:hypothetical protein